MLDGPISSHTDEEILARRAGIEAPLTRARYSTLLLTDCSLDVEKLSRSPGILQSALLIVLFCRDPETIEHDLAAWLDHGLRCGLSVQSPSVRSFAITDRIGNRYCGLGLFPVRPSLETHHADGDAR